MSLSFETPIFTHRIGSFVHSCLGLAIARGVLLCTFNHLHTRTLKLNVPPAAGEYIGQVHGLERDVVFVDIALQVQQAG